MGEEASICHQGHVYQFVNVRYPRCPCGERYTLPLVHYGDEPLGCVDGSLWKRVEDTKIAHMEKGTITLETYDIRAMIAQDRNFWHGHIDMKLTPAQRTKDPYKGVSSAELLKLRQEYQLKEWELQVQEMCKKLNQLKLQYETAVQFVYKKCVEVAAGHQNSLDARCRAPCHCKEK